MLDNEPGARLSALGNEAIARGAMEARLRFATAYPGPPSTRIMETFIGAAFELEFAAYWSVNEKVALDAARASSSNAPSMAVMKQAGLNGAADSIQQLKLTDIAGGFAVVSVDDPSGASSNNEHDNRWYAKSAGLPADEPADLDQAGETTSRAFDISEELPIPIHMRTIIATHRNGRDAMLEAMQRYFPHGVRWTGPEGGVFLWLTLPEGVDTLDLFTQSVEVETACVPASCYHARSGWPGEQDAAELLRLREAGDRTWDTAIGQASREQSELS